MTTQQELKKHAAWLEEQTHGRVALTSYSPGDGMTRYRLGTTSAADGRHDYFGDYAIANARGSASTLVMVDAFIAGMTYRP